MPVKEQPGHHSHGHSHSHSVRVSAATQRRLLVALAPFVVATLVGVISLWPSGTKLSLPAAGDQVNYEATITSVEREKCDLPGQEGFDCAIAEVRLNEGPEAGETVTLNIAEGPNGRHVAEGDGILVGRASEGEAAQRYFFADFQRDRPLIVLVVLFALVVVALSRMRGLYSLVGLVASLAILVKFVLPAILQGEDPVLVAVFGGAAIMFIALYMAHGFNAMTTTAVLGTLVSLGVTGVLALIFVEAFKFTGFSSEEAIFLQVAAQQVNLEGLLLASIVIGTLGVLDDVTVTQASAVWELHIANPELGSRGLYAAAVRIGRDHIASTVNTLVLAYAGAALPLLVLFTLADRSFSSVVTSEVVGEEIVRTLVGSIGLICSVPITTALAAIVASGDRGSKLLRRPPSASTTATASNERARAKDYRRPRAEEFFRADDE